MEKVVFSVKKRNGEKITGLGMIVNNDLLIPAVSKGGKSYIRIFTDCLDDCKKVIDQENEYKGEHIEYINIDNKDVPITYLIWFKKIQ